jgi:F0F1-type ATP synthase membrane subunit c/vacuolar-type H+-ATPase subunit K
VCFGISNNAVSLAVAVASLVAAIAAAWIANSSLVQARQVVSQAPELNTLFTATAAFKQDSVRLL